ncbi:MarR family transcriptional regulator [Lentzea sp. NBRC 105346]|uniref:MarR family transcriptional regulator n=1 Tax=Lentzea sp. NBRC 105346 TaxID=3032205 RepID=UPI002553BCFD|nr:MarR family transcriptional regulator [Lentzea sp. NBRC 105346]
MKIYSELGLTDLRPRYVPVVRALRSSSGLSIRDLATALGVTHSAASQTVNQMAKDGLVELRPGSDARQRIAQLTPRALALIPIMDAEWAATEAARAEFDAELAYPLSQLVAEAIELLERRPFRDRIRYEGPAAPG